MIVKALPLLFLSCLFSIAVFLGSFPSGSLLLFVGCIAFVTRRREIALIDCVGWAALFLSILLREEINVLAVILLPLLIQSFWEGVIIKKTHASVPQAESAMRRRMGRFTLYMASLFCITLLFHGVLTSFSLGSPLFLVVFLSSLLLASLYLFVAKGF